MTDWTTSVSRDIAADASTLFGLVADVTRMGEWSPENHTNTWKEGFDSPVVGAEWLGDNVNGEFEWQTEGQVTETVPGEVFAFDAKVGDFVFAKWRYEFESIDGGTRVTEHTLDLRPEKVKAMGAGISGVDDRDARNRETMEATLAALAAATEQA
ncbi:MAG: SRPBCC family protein [Actinomycetota bacterium]